MSEIEKRQDKIDEYIRGTMSERERIIFEEELRQDEVLGFDVKIQRTIADAVQAVQLKSILQAMETRISRPRRTFTKAAYRYACGAAILAVLFLIGNNWRQSLRIKRLGNDCYASMTVTASRGSEKADSLLALAHSQIGIGLFDLAEDNLAEANRLISESLQLTVLDEESQYIRAISEQKQYEAAWLQAIIDMRRGQYRKVKDELKKIASSESPFAEKATNILNTMFNIKIK